MDRNINRIRSTSVLIIVALRKESVDRNLVSSINRAVNIMSLSARRAWIEILILARQVCLTCRRSPQGERG